MHDFHSPNSTISTLIQTIGLRYQEGKWLTKLNKDSKNTFINPLGSLTQLVTSFLVMLLFTHIFLNFHSNFHKNIQPFTENWIGLYWAIKYLTFITTSIILFIQSFLRSYLIKRYELLYETIVDVFLERHWSGKEKRKNIWLLRLPV